ncbi:LysR family transcriptional regulator [Myxococcaceae bacterium JPH2]|nr:LysR family transcriptional regulator [Myxococcaceae bacterium JPH2]
MASQPQRGWHGGSRCRLCRPSPRTWRVGDLYTKHEMLRAGLGWDNLPEHLIREDLRKGTLVVLRTTAWGNHEDSLSLLAIYRSDTVFGPAHRWLLKQLAQLCAKEARLR